MNSRTLFFTAVLIAALALGAGLMLAQDDGGSDDDSPASAKEHSGFGRHGAMGRGFHDFGRGAMGRGMMERGSGMPDIGADLYALVMEATGLELEALRSAMAEGSSLASLIEANGGDVAAFIAQATELASARVNEGIAARIEALVNGERPAGTKDVDGRGYGRRAWGGPQGFGGPGMSTLAADAFEMLTEATGLEAAALHSALAEGNSLASLIEANGGDVADFIAQASAAFNDSVDAAVADGKLSEERAAMLKEGMAERIEALVNAEHEGRGWRKPAGKDERKGGSAAAMDSGEESGTTFAPDEIFDEVRNGVRLVISYDAAANAFSGAIENTTGASIQQVRVEVHLSNGVELGPTATVSLAPGETREVRLDATGQDFEGWSAHAETGSAEHSGEGEGEHGSEGSESAEG